MAFGAKDILINVKGDGRDFNAAMVGASTSVKTFGATASTSMKTVAVSSVGAATGMRSVGVAASTTAATTTVAAAGMKAFGAATVAATVAATASMRAMSTAIATTAAAAVTGAAIIANASKIAALKFVNSLNSEQRARERNMAAAIRGLAVHRKIMESTGTGILSKWTNTMRSVQIVTSLKIHSMRETFRGLGRTVLTTGASIKAFAINSVTSMKAAAVGIASSMATATAGLTLVIAAVVAFGIAMRKAVLGAADDQAVIAQTTALLGQQGIMWSDVGEDVTDYIENLERLTLFGDTELQESFNSFLALGMDVDKALRSTAAAAAIANGSNLNLAASAKMLGNQYSTNTSRLKQLNLTGVDYEDTLKKISDTMGTGSQVTGTLGGKWKMLGNELMNLIKPLGEQLIPMLSDFFDITIWGVKNVFPIFTYTVKGIISVITGLWDVVRYTTLTLKAFWQALRGDITGMNETLDKLNRIKDVTSVRLDLETEITTEIEDQNDELAKQLSTMSKLDQAWLKAGNWIGSGGDTYMTAKDAGFSGNVPTTVIDTGRAHGDNLYQGFTPSSVTVNVTTGDINNQGDVAELGKQVAAAVAGNRSGI